MQKNNADRSWSSLSAVLMDDTQIAEANEQYMDHEGPTDCISFTYETPTEDGIQHIGEILINVEQATKLGTGRGGPSRELGLYIAHACLHLCGEDDTMVTERAAMRRTERRWLNSLRDQLGAEDFYR